MASELPPRTYVVAEDDPFSTPVDFPRVKYMGAVPGTQPKLLVTQYEGKYYPTGCTPPEVHASYEYCESVAQHLAKKSIESKAGKRSEMTEEAILDQYYVRLVGTGWVSAAEAIWTMKRCASVLSWPLPKSVIDAAASMAPVVI